MHLLSFHIFEKQCRGVPILQLLGHYVFVDLGFWSNGTTGSSFFIILGLLFLDFRDFTVGLDSITNTNYFYLTYYRTLLGKESYLGSQRLLGVKREKTSSMERWS